MKHIMNYIHEEHSLYHNEQCTFLSRLENDVLQLLCSNINKQVPRREVLNHVWTVNEPHINCSLNNVISKLRKKLRNNSEYELITIARTKLMLGLKKQ